MYVLFVDFLDSFEYFSVIILKLRFGNKNFAEFRR